MLEKQQRFDETAGMSINEMVEQRQALREVDRRTTAGTGQSGSSRRPSRERSCRWSTSPIASRRTGSCPAGRAAPCTPRTWARFWPPAIASARSAIPSKLVAEIIVDQSDVELVRAARHEREQDGLPGVPVMLMLDSLPGRSFDTEIEQIAAGRAEGDAAGPVHAGRRRCGFGGGSADRRAATAEHFLSRDCHACPMSAANCSWACAARPNCTPGGSP